MSSVVGAEALSNCVLCPALAPLAHKGSRVGVGGAGYSGRVQNRGCGSLATIRDGNLPLRHCVCNRQDWLPAPCSVATWLSCYSISRLRFSLVVVAYAPVWHCNTRQTVLGYWLSLG